MENNGYSLIFTIINKGFSEQLMEAARGAGAKGGTVLNARGTGAIECEKILGVDIHPEKEIVLILTHDSFRQPIMKAIYKEVGLETDASGFSFSLPVEDILGSNLLTEELIAD